MARRILWTAVVSGLFATTASAADNKDSQYRVVVMKPAAADVQLISVEDVTSILRHGEYAVETLDAAALVSKPDALRAVGADLLVVAGAGSVPAEALPAVQRFVEAGGDVLALGAPLASEPLAKVGEQWMTHRAYREKLKALPPGRVLFDFDKEDLARWPRNCRDGSLPFSSELVEGHAGKALHLHIHDLFGWDGVTSPPLTQPFPTGHTLTSFWAKGRPGLQNLSLEWREKDGSRWIAVFPVSEKWERVVLSPADFRYWQSTPGRGGEGDRFKPGNACGLTIAMSWSHTGLETGEHEFWIDEFGTMADPYGDAANVLVAPPPAIEGLCPAYKFYELNDVAKMAYRAPAVGDALPLPKAGTIQAHHPRPTGKGGDKKRGWRWIPVVEALGPKGEWRGAPVSMFVNTVGPLKGSVRAAVSVADPEWYRQPAVRTMIAGLVERMARGAFFEEGGAVHFAQPFPSPGPDPAVTPFRIHARAFGLSKCGPVNAEIRYKVASANKSTGTTAGSIRGTLRAEPPMVLDLLCGIREAGDYIVTAGLYSNDRLLDEISHEFCTVQSKPAEERRFVTVRDGDFWLGGRKWYAHGVNYMPSTGIGVEEREYFEYWMDAAPYDPEFIQRDLQRCRDMGFNCVSIFIYHRSLAARNLWDILQRCERLGLKVNLSIRPGTPMAYDPVLWEDIILKAGLAENDTLIAYDIAWEPFFGTQAERCQYDPQWLAWVEKKHGSLAAAEKAWGVPAPRQGDRVTNPGPEQLGLDGPHRKMVADYRHFVDDLLHEKYSAAAERIRKLDPNHLVSFRMTDTSNPTCLGESNMPYDFPGVARAMDFLAPEAYGRIGPWEHVRDGAFEIAYARMCASSKPVLWAEAGMSAWGKQLHAYDPKLAAQQEQFFRDFYKMVLQSGSQGVIWWWYPGGYRTNEDSDYGIINPDGTDRLCTKVIREFAPKVLAPREIPKPDAWLEIDRDADARGLYGAYEKVKAEYWKLTEAGKTVGLRAPAK